MLITSVNNQNVILWHKLKQTKFQRKYQKFIIEEKLLIEEAKKANLNYILIALADSEIKADYYVSDNVMRKISHNQSLNELVAVVDFYNVKSSSADKVVYLDKVQDPGNVGTIIRSAKAFGYDKVVLNKSVSKYNSKLISAAKGASFSIEIDETSNLADFADYYIYGSMLDENATNLDDISSKPRFVVVFGNEGSGISNDLLPLVDEKVYIEMEDFDSLNVAVAAGIILHHLR